MRWNNMYAFLGSLIMGVGIATGGQLALGSVERILIENEFRDTSLYHEKLKTDVQSLKRTREDQEKRLKQYADQSEDSEHILEELKKELARNEKLLGYREVRGPGYIITMADGITGSEDPDNPMDSWLRIIHNEDMLKVLNDLRQNGAEAISINGERITETSEIYCSWAFIAINGKKLLAPFVIRVVGSPEKLDAYVGSEFTQLRNLSYRGIRLQTEKMPIIILEASIPPIVPKYLQELEE